MQDIWWILSIAAISLIVIICSHLMIVFFQNLFSEPPNATAAEEARIPKQKLTDLREPPPPPPPITKTEMKHAIRNYLYQLKAVKINSR